MITIRIKTPKDYWKQFQEWIKVPRQQQANLIASLYNFELQKRVTSKDNHYLDFLSNEDKIKVQTYILEEANSCHYIIKEMIEKCYPKYNLPNKQR